MNLKSLRYAALHAALLSLIGLGMGCGFGDPGWEEPPSGESMGTIAAAAGQWTWVPFTDTFCDDGTPTGIGVNPGSSDNLLLFMNGGGACCDYASCYAIGTATHGPYGAKEFASQSFGKSILDRSSQTNPFRDWNFVFIPYCTSDLHAGNRVMTYSFAGDSRTYHHRGHDNITKYMKRIAATFRKPTRLAITGSSGGGFGAALNYAYIRGIYPGSEAYLVDDSGPPLATESGISACRRNWGADALIDTFCPGCLHTPSKVPEMLSKRFPKDRLALLSADQDLVISAFLGVSPSDFKTRLNTLAVTTLGPLQNFRYYFVPGLWHTMLYDPAEYKSQDTDLASWLKQMLANDPSWTSRRP